MKKSTNYAYLSGGVQFAILKIGAHTLRIERADEGGYVVHVPSLHGIATQGETYLEAVRNARDLIAGYEEWLDGDEDYGR